MIFIAQSITLFYDERQDRLSLLFIDMNGGKESGAITRRFMKGLLVVLPEWIAKNTAQLASQSQSNQSVQQQRDINQFHHQAAQQNIAASYNAVKIDKTVMPWLIDTINVSKQNIVKEGSETVEQVKLIFIDAAKQKEVVLSITLAQLHKLIGEMLVKAKGWELSNPWQSKAGSTDLLGNTVGVMH